MSRWRVTLWLGRAVVLVRTAHAAEPEVAVWLTRAEAGDGVRYSHWRVVRG